MTDFNEGDHPRVSNGTFTDKAQSGPEVSVAHPTPTFGSFPVKLVDLPDAEVYRLTAAALAVGRGGLLVPYFSALELQRLISVVNTLENESDEPLLIGSFESGPAYIQGNGVVSPLPSIFSAYGRLYALDADGATNEFELTEGEWFDTTPPAEADVEAISRSWTVRRDDGQYVTRTVEWSAGEFISPESHRMDGFSVWKRVEDTVADSFGPDAIQEPVEDPFAEDTLASDKVFDSYADAEHWARTEAKFEQADQHVEGWDGYSED
jgi:hypothetical protein